MSKKTKSALRYNIGKEDFNLIDYKSLIPLIKVMEFGENKYSRNNWKQGGFSKESILNSLLRHTAKLSDAVSNNTSEFDEESFVHHIGSIMANAMFYSHYFVDTPIDPDVNWEEHLNNIQKKFKQ